MKIGNQPAFPDSHPDPDTYPGMTYRQWLIGIIASGYAAYNNDDEALTTSGIAIESFTLTEKILAMLEDEQKKQSNSKNQ